MLIQDIYARSAIFQASFLSMKLQNCNSYHINQHILFVFQHSKTKVAKENRTAHFNLLHIYFLATSNVQFVFVKVN